MQQNPRMFGGFYQVGQVITSGPLLTVYSAYNRYSSDVVGLYVVELPPTVNEEAAEGLLQVFEQRRRVQSPHVIHVYDWGVDGARVYIATDPPRGLTLRHVLDGENLELRRTLDLARQMARGLVAFQERGLVNIDMRPQLITVDILEESYRAQLDDIGLRLFLKQLGYVSSQREGDIGYLDPRYAAPESIQNGPIGAWSDVYQLGLLIYETVTGRLPFVGRTAAETSVMQYTNPVPPMAHFNHETPQAVQDLVERALAKNPAQRFADAAALLQALEGLSIAGKSPFSQENLSLASTEEPLPTMAEIGWLPANRIGGPTSEIPAAPAKSEGIMKDTFALSKSMARNGGEGGQGGQSPDDEEGTIHRISPTPIASDASKTSPLDQDEEGALAYLYYEPEGGTPQRFAIKSNYVIVGRVDPKRGVTPEIDLSAIDREMTISRQHARIRYEQTFFTIEDLKSRNKTRLREQALPPLKPEVLRHGDVVHFGSVRMVFRVVGPTDATIMK